MNRPRSKPLAAAAAALAAVLPAVIAGCGEPTATLDLLGVARMGIADAERAETAHHAEAMENIRRRVAELDEAFDADVRLVAAGHIRDADGGPIALTPEWVIAARKGYVAARDALGDQSAVRQADHAVRMDNLKAADEALDMAAQLVLQRQALADHVRDALLAAQRRLTDGK